jgi:hypothetical protein
MLVVGRLPLDARSSARRLLRDVRRFVRYEPYILAALPRT